MWTIKNKESEIILNSEWGILEEILKLSKISWIILIVLWILWIILPYLMTLTTLIFIAYIMLLAGLSMFFFTYLSNKKDWIWYLKWFILFLTGIFIVLKPGFGIQALGVIFIFYFFVDWFINLMLALSAGLKNGSWIWLINSLLLFWLWIIFIISWNTDLVLLIGIFVGISLFFDWISLLITWKLLGKILKN